MESGQCNKLQLSVAICTGCR